MEPARWKDTKETLEPELSTALEQARNLAPSTGQLDAISARIQAVLEAEGAELLANDRENVSARGAKPGSLATLTKAFRRELLMIGVVVAGLAFGGGVLVGRNLQPARHGVNGAPEVTRTDAPTKGGDEPARSVALPPSRAAAVPEPLPTTLEHAPPRAKPATTPTAVFAPRKRTSMQQGLPEATKADSPPATDEVVEVELLHRARRLIESNPARALSLLDEHASRFRDGMFREERSALAIEALFRTGQRESADTLARDFRARFPNSAYLPRITQLSPHKR